MEKITGAKNWLPKKPYDLLLFCFRNFGDEMFNAAEKWQERTGVKSTGMNRGKPHMNSDSTDPHEAFFVAIFLIIFSHPLKRDKNNKKHQSFPFLF